MSAHRRGRPRDQSLDVAILEAAARQLTDGGYGALSVESVAAGAGTTRAAVYRRHPTLAGLTIAVLTARFGLDPSVETGTLAGDLRAMQQHRAALFTDPLLVRALPGLLDDISRHPALAASFSADFLGPRRSATDRVLRAAVERGEIHDPVDAEWISDLLTGPLLARTLLPGLRAIDDDLVEHTVAAALHELERGREPGRGRDPAQGTS